MGIWYRPRLPAPPRRAGLAPPALRVSGHRAPAGGWLPYPRLRGATTGGAGSESSTEQYRRRRRNGRPRRAPRWSMCPTPCPAARWSSTADRNAASGVETNHQRRAADPLGEVIDVVRQVVAAGLFARLDQNDATRMRYSLLLQRQQRTERPEHRVPVIGTAAAVELVAFETRDPGAVPLRPPYHLRLLVEMAIEQHGVLIPAGNLDENDRSAPRQPDDLE